MTEPIYVNVDADDRQVTEIESMCMECGKNGTTRLLLTRIPHFKEVILMAFECPHCGNRNNEIQSGNMVAEQGVIQSCRIDSKADLNRQIVKSEYASIRLPEIEFEIPPMTQKGLLNTVEGFVRKAMEDLAQDQPQRKLLDEPTWAQIEAVLQRMDDLLASRQPFTIVIDDPSGNSYIENLCAPNKDPKMAIKHYTRTAAQEHELGFSGEQANGAATEQTEEAVNNAANATEPEAPSENWMEEVLVFPANCSSCHAPSDTKMKMVNIPYFKEVIIMSTACDACGYKSNEVKAGGAVAPQGKRITLKVTDAEDMSRDVLKSESCGLRVPEIDLELDAGTLGGRFTTLEGLLDIIYEELDSRAPFTQGDSVEGGKRQKLNEFLAKLRKIINFEVPFTFILDDPLGNSYLQNLYAPEPDPNMTVELYDRTWEQDEFLGLNDIQTEDYEATAATGSNLKSIPE